MMKLFPTEILDWINRKDFNLDNFYNDSPIVCFLEFGPDYLDELHDLHNDYTLAGEQVKVTEEMMLEYQLQIKKDNSIFLGKNEKLILNLGNKRKYKLHHQNLELYLNLAL